MAEKLRDLERKEKQQLEDSAKKKTERRKGITKEQSARKWKGKDWFVILAPKVFNQKAISETPTINPKTLIGRNIEVSLGELTGQYGRDYYRFIFKIDSIEGKNANTRFHGYLTMKEHILRMIRKRSQKVEITSYFMTKDNWKIQTTAVAILNRNTESPVQTKMRLFIEDSLKKATEKSTMDMMVKDISTGSIQRDIKKAGCKIYPIRLFEISKIEVIKAPSA